MRRHRTITAALSLALAIATTTAVPATANDNDQLAEHTVTTYRVDLDERVVHVDATVTLRNQAKPTRRRGPCSNGRGTCTLTTNYYFHDWGSFWTPYEALEVRIGGPKVKAQEPAEIGGGMAYGVTYPKLWNKKGKSQRASIAFEMPVGTVETTEFPTRIEDAYAYLCWWGMVGDTGTTKAVFPAGWAVTPGWDAGVTVERTPEATVVSATQKRNPAGFMDCTEAYDLAAFERTYATGSDGRSLIVIEAWPGDGDWADEMTATATAALETFETLFGTPMPYGELRVREVATQSRRYRYADLRPVEGVMGVTEDASASDILPSRIARAWIEPGHFSDTWLAEGIAYWLGTVLEEGWRCPEAADHPGPEAPDIDAWQPEHADLTLRDWQVSTSCGIVEAAAEVVGDEAMFDIIRELVESPVPVGTDHWLSAVSRDLPQGLGAVTAALDAAGADYR